MDKSYKNPPVIEALCEFFFEGSKWDPTIPGLFYEKVKKEYPQKKAVSNVKVKVDFSPEGEAVQTHRTAEARTQFIRPDGSALVQVARNLLAFNQLRPYPRFEEWKPKALEALSIYKELCRPKKIGRMGVRYINQILIPCETIRMEDYFSLYPQLPVEIKLHGRFSMSLEIPIQKNHLTTTTLGNAPPDTVGCLKYIFDIYDIIQPPIYFEAIEDLINQAHENVEKIFENSITNELRKLFEEVK